MRAAIVALALTAAFTAWGDDTIWRWVDGEGEEHYTNDKGSIPEKFRAGASSTAGSELSVITTSEGSAVPAPAAKPGAVVPVRPAPARKAAAIHAILFESVTNSASKTLRRAGVVEKLVSDNPGLQLERIEFGRAVERAEELKVTEVPTLLFLDENGVERGRFVGPGTVSQLQLQLDKARGFAK